ncbi:MAG: IS1595 family transposase [Mesorhizobium sp.]|uniref:Transposase zinc-ribbon domain-containing protein n=1 Tax=Mesorhizobium mediterraneum TaxID=43617 RepID=A0AB36R9C5_9HYPH|nr:hypothetical protein CIT25_18495 [Mesorhizobium mediterraneum]RWN40252.1 MAG: IS1595 family transposase [Mesorhizobium sp.]
MCRIKSIKDLAPLLTDELKAGDFIRDLRWPSGVTCAHCDHGTVYELKGRTRIGVNGNALTAARSSV